MNKTKIVNVVVVLVVIALIGFVVWNNKKDNKNNSSSNTDNSMTTDAENTNKDSSMIGGVTLPITSGIWTPQSINNEITFETPEEYYVSHPVIGECEDVTSISTQSSNAPTIAIALIYKAGCVKDSDVTANYTHQVIKNGYVFQTSSNSPSVVAMYNKIVASAK
jgi:hypothetical protein